MLRMKAMLLGLLALLAMGSVVSATASAAPVGPWFRTPEAANSQKQVKIGYNQEKQVKGKIVQGTSFTLKGKIAGIAAVVKCTVAKSKGNIWNGLFQGEDNAEVIFEGCTTGAPCPANTTVEVVPSKVYSELQWKYQGNQSELTETGPQMQQKIYDVFAPTALPEQREGLLRAVFTKINLPEICHVTPSELPVEATGTEAEFVDQNQAGHRIVWGTAALTEPQNEDGRVGLLTWKLPNVTQLHHQGGQTKAKLQLAGAAAELEGTIEVGRENGELYGVYNE